MRMLKKVRLGKEEKKESLKLENGKLRIVS